MRLIDPWVELSLSFNPGTAFSFVQDLGVGRVVFGIVALLVVVVLAIVAVRSRDKWVHALALGTIAGGAIGNGVDRIFHAGVVDFIKLNYPGGSWPTFNVADALVAIGVAMLLIHQWVARDPRSPEATSSG